MDGQLQLGTDDLVFFLLHLDDDSAFYRAPALALYAQITKQCSNSRFMHNLDHHICTPLPSLISSANNLCRRLKIGYPASDLIMSLTYPPIAHRLHLSSTSQRYTRHFRISASRLAQWYVASLTDCFVTIIDKSWSLRIESQHKSLWSLDDVVQPHLTA